MPYTHVFPWERKTKDSVVRELECVVDTVNSQNFLKKISKTLLYCVGRGEGGVVAKPIQILCPSATDVWKSVKAMLLIEKRTLAVSSLIHKIPKIYFFVVVVVKSLGGSLDLVNLASAFV